MPACFCLYSKYTKEQMSLTEVDEIMCAHFNEPVDKDKWLGDWYNAIGLGLAMGKSWQDLRDLFTSESNHAMIDYLEATYTTDCWHEQKM
jgi:hypothetical protein